MSTRNILEDGKNPVQKRKFESKIIGRLSTSSIGFRFRKFHVVIVYRERATKYIPL